MRPLALVTGVGRSVGIGAAITAELWDDGWEVAAAHWPSYDERLHLGDPGVVGSGRFVADLSDPASVPTLFDEVMAEHGRSPSALVINHCESVASDLLTTTVDSFDRHYAVNVRASWLLIRELACRFPAGGRGRVVALTSDHTAGNIPYGSSKGALDRLVIAAASELAPQRISCNVINPGPTDTGWMTEELKPQLIAATAGGRLGQPRDAARLVRFLCSEEGGWINGQLLHSNGGFDL